MPDWSALAKRLRITFKDPSLLQQAFIHRSYLNENPDFLLSSNERLEFLGDAVLGIVVAEGVYRLGTLDDFAGACPPLVEKRAIQSAKRGYELKLRLESNYRWHLLAIPNPSQRYGRSLAFYVDETGEIRAHSADCVEAFSRQRYRSWRSIE